MSELDQRFHTLRKIVGTASRDLERHRRADRNADIRHKPDGSLVSAADFAAEQVIVESIRSLFPDDSIIAEESGRYEGCSGWHWIVDPLDGTANYIAGTGEYAVAAALVGQGGEQAAVIDLPASGITIMAVPDGGLAVTGATVCEPGTGTLMCGVGFASAGELRLEQIDALRSYLGLEVEIREIGSASASMCRVALGQFDAYCEVGLPAWDVVPGLCVARAAGATVITPRDVAATLLPGARSTVLVARPRAAAAIGAWWSAHETEVAAWRA